MNFQVVNTLTPNAVHNTCVFSCFEGGDSITNLHVSLDRYKDNVHDLMGMMWKYVLYHLFVHSEQLLTLHCLDTTRCVLFLCGDYEFLCRLYGLSGASGRHPCLWCH